MPNESFAPRLNTGELLARPLQLRELLFRAIHVRFMSTAEREQLLLSLQISEGGFDFGLLLFRRSVCCCFFSLGDAGLLLGLRFALVGLLGIAFHKLETRLGQLRLETDHTPAA